MLGEAGISCLEMPEQAMNLNKKKTWGYIYDRMIKLIENQLCSLYRQLWINSGGAALLLICTSLISQHYRKYFCIISTWHTRDRWSATWCKSPLHRGVIQSVMSNLSNLLSSSWVAEAAERESSHIFLSASWHRLQCDWRPRCSWKTNQCATDHSYRLKRRQVYLWKRTKLPITHSGRIQRVCDRSYKSEGGHLYLPFSINYSGATYDTTF
jgi:hypothetical protein